MATPTTNPQGTGASQVSPELNMTLTEHLAELRYRLIVIVSALCVCVLVAFLVSEDVIRIIQALAPPSVTFVQLTPGEVFLSSLQLSFWLGMVFALPVILFQVFRFVSPGLVRHEGRMLLGIVTGGTFLFVCGVLFAYVFVVPPALRFLLSFGENVALLQMSVGRFLSFCTSFLLLIGLVFEMPMLLLLLSFTGLVKARHLIGQWRLAIVGIFILSAFLTPSQDPLTMLIVAAAMMALYFSSVLIISCFEKQKEPSKS